ncbi:MAG TPA: glucosamine-6-phosphate deaminase [Acidimicrobiales bacterium]
MEVVIVAGPAEAGALVGGAIAALVAGRPTAVLGLATGSSPLPVYADLARRHAAGELSLAAARAFLLDEYVGLPPGHPQAYRAFVAEHLESGVDLAPGAVQAPDVAAADLPAACRRYEEAIAAAGGVDLQLLGIGGDGHIGFNEPGSSLASRTRLKTLTDATRRANARFFGPGDEVPRHVLTQGVGTILEARHLVLVATGAAKAAAVARAVEGPVTAMVPGSALQLHPHATVVVDEPAAADLALAGYYRETWAHKPAWQGI